MEVLTVSRYSYPEDPYVLKGSCGVEYRLGLTEAGYEKYGNSFKRKFMGNGDISGSGMIFGAKDVHSH